MLQLLLLIPITAQGGGQYKPFHEEDGSYGAAFGSSAANLGDIDGDGVPDFAVGAPWEGHSPFLGPPGVVHVYSGATLDPIFELVGSHNNQGFGHDVASAGDVDADGVGDLLVGTWDSNYSGSAFVYSGATGAILYQFTGTGLWEYLGSSVSALDDIDGDGFDDFLIGASGHSPPGLDRTGAVFAHSGRTGAMLYRVDGKLYGDYFGIEISVMDDFDGDGIKDFLVGAPFGDPWFPSMPIKAGEVRAFSGADGQELFQKSGHAPYSGFGSTISTSGDLDGDGINDLAVGAGGEKGFGGLRDIGAVYLFSGSDYSLQRRLMGGQSEAVFGSKVLITPDLNQDGSCDLLVAQVKYNPGGLYQAGSVFLYAGESGLLLKRWYGEDASGFLGSSLAFLGDLNNDQQPEWLIGSSGIYSQGTFGAHNGGVFSFTFDPLMRANVVALSGTSGGTMHLDLDFPESERDLPYQIFISNTGVGPTHVPGAFLPLSRDVVLRRTLLGEAPPMLQGGQGFLDDFGNATASFTVPGNLPSSLWNTTRWFAAASLDTSMQQVRLVSVPLALEILP